MHPTTNEPQPISKDEAINQMQNWLMPSTLSFSENMADDWYGVRGHKRGAGGDPNVVPHFHPEELPEALTRSYVDDNGEEQNPAGDGMIYFDFRSSVFRDFITIVGPYPNRQNLGMVTVLEPMQQESLKILQGRAEDMIAKRRAITLDAQFKSLDIKTTFEIPIKIHTVTQILMNEGRAPAHNLLRKLLEAVKETIPALKLAMRPISDDPSYIDIFPAAINMDGAIQEVFSEMSINSMGSDITSDARRSIEQGRTVQSDLGSSYNISSPKVMVCQFGQGESIVENFGLSSKIDPNAFTSYRLPAIVGGASMNVTNIIRDDPQMFDEVLTDMASILRDGVGVGREHLKTLNIITTDEAGQVQVNSNRLRELLETQNIPQIEKVATGLIEDLMSQNVQLYNKVMLQQQHYFSQRSEGDISLGGGEVRTPGSKFYGTVLSTFLRTATLTIHGTTGLNVFDLVYLKGLLSGVEGLYLISSVNESLAASSFTTTLECKLVEYTDNNAQTNPMAYRGTASLASLAAQVKRIEDDENLGVNAQYKNMDGDQYFSVLAEYIQRDDVAAGRLE